MLRDSTYSKQHLVHVPVHTCLLGLLCHERVQLSLRSLFSSSALPPHTSVTSASRFPLVDVDECFVLQTDVERRSSFAEKANVTASTGSCVAASSSLLPVHAATAAVCGRPPPVRRTIVSPPICPEAPCWTQRANARSSSSSSSSRPASGSNASFPPDAQ